MPVFTCAEMVESCLAGQDDGWRHFLTQYLPFAAALIDRHYPELASRRESLLREVLLRARDQDTQFFRDYRGHSEREFLVHLRGHVLRVLEENEPGAAPEVLLEWDDFERAFASLTALERQAVWLRLLSPKAGDMARLLRADQPSVDAIQARTQEQLRAALDHWSADLLERNRHRLADQARARRTVECPDPRAFLRLLDGQNPWRDREEAEHHLAACWYCVDLLCRFREVARLAKLSPPWTPAQAEPYARAIGVAFEQPSRWRRLLGSV